MSNIRIMTDSASDISSADEQSLGIAVIPFPITLSGRTYTSRVDFANDEFYRLMAEHDDIPTTSQITPFQFQEIYLNQARAGVSDLILVLINSEGSSTYANSLQAIDLFYEEHPEYRSSFRIHSLDGMGYNALYGAPVVRAAQMAREGAQAQEIVDYLGDKLNIRPIMKIFDRAITTAAKCRGERSLLSRLADMSIADMEPGSPYEVIYGCDETCRDEMRRLMVERLGYEPTAYYQIGAAVAANAGPKVAGVAFTRRA